jgi:transposase
MLPTPPDSTIQIRHVRTAGATVVLEAAGMVAAGRCPTCGGRSDHVHDRYQRRPLDLPWRGHVVRLHLTVRRFRCANPQCPRATFAEDFGPHLPRHAWRTADADHLLLSLALTAGGEGGSRLAHASGLPTSPDTLLRLIRRQPELPCPTPRVLGVDDLSLRRGHRYATLLLDLETHRPIDLVAGRTTDDVQAWLRQHAGVECIVRDRAEAYAEGARSGAPGAEQVADRFHLVQNASAALDTLLLGRRRSIAWTTPTTTTTTEQGAKPLSPSRQREVDRRTARIARWARVRAMRAAGASISGVAREFGMDRRTVRRLLAIPEPPHHAYLHPRPSGLRSPTLQPYVSYLQDRWQQGCHNISQLCREIRAQGYPGSRSLLAQALAPWRPPRPPPGSRQRKRRRLRWLCLRPPEQLTTDERQALEQVLAADADLQTGYTLLQRFRKLVAERAVTALDPWLADAQASALPSFVALANGILADRDAVDAALSTPWSNGPTEGHVGRVKLLKRQMYGRAKLDLLRRRVLAG